MKQVERNAHLEDRGRNPVPKERLWNAISTPQEDQKYPSVKFSYYHFNLGTFFLASPLLPFVQHSASDVDYLKDKIFKILNFLKQRKFSLYSCLSSKRFLRDVKWPYIFASFI